MYVLGRVVTPRVYTEEHTPPINPISQSPYPTPLITRYAVVGYIHSHED